MGILIALVLYIIAKIRRQPLDDAYDEELERGWDQVGGI